MMTAAEACSTLGLPLVELNIKYFMIVLVKLNYRSFGAFFQFCVNLSEVCSDNFFTKKHELKVII